MEKKKTGRYKTRIVRYKVTTLKDRHKWRYIKLQLLKIDTIVRYKVKTTGNNLHTNTLKTKTLRIHHAITGRHTNTLRMLVNSPLVFSFLNMRDLIKPATGSAN